MDNVDIRSVATREELERAFDIWGTVFSEGRAFFQERLDYDPTYVMNTTWIASVNGKVAAAIQIFPYYMWCGIQPIKVGGIGSVATLPEYRNRGLAQEILRLQSRWMKNHNYDLSLLFTGIHSFYEQVGWSTIPGREYVFDCSNLPEIPLSPDYTVVPFDNAYLEAVMAIYDEYNRFRSAARLRTKEYWVGQNAWRVSAPSEFLIAKKLGRPMAYIRFNRKNGDLVLRDCCYLIGEEAAVSVLFSVCIKMQQSEAQTFRANLPEDHILSIWLQTWQAESVETTSAMWKILDFPLLLTKLESTFTRRVLNAQENYGVSLPCRLLLRIGESEVIVSIRNRSVEVEAVTERAEYQDWTDLTETEFITLLLKGIEGMRENLKLYKNPYLHLLFPGQNSVFWNADTF